MSSSGGTAGRAMEDIWWAGAWDNEVRKGGEKTAGVVGGKRDQRQWRQTAAEEYGSTRKKNRKSRACTYSSARAVLNNIACMTAELQKHSPEMLVNT